MTNAIDATKYQGIESLGAKDAKGHNPTSPRHERPPVSDLKIKTCILEVRRITYYLAANPDKANILQDEVRSAFNGPDGYKEINFESTKTLHYLVATVEEGLRIYPPSAFGLPRVSPGAVVDGHHIPKGTTVQVPNFLLARSERYFSRPKEFHPERWLPTDMHCTTKNSHGIARRRLGHSREGREGVLQSTCHTIR